MVYITGDCHGNWERFSERIFPEQTEMSRDDFVIVCGDFGLWHNTKDERERLKQLEDKNFTILFVDGNHENFDRLYTEFETVDFYGGKAHKVRENIYHLIRGHIFNLCGKQFFAFGGASSHDIDDGVLDKDEFASEKDFQKTLRVWNKQGKMFRINHVSWWEQEIPSREEMNFGISNLKNNNNRVDYIITHCCPQEIASIFSYGAFQPDQLTLYFNTIASIVSFSKWFFGHYHDNMQIMNKYIMLYDQITRIV